MKKHSNFDCTHGNCRILQPICGRVVREGSLGQKTQEENN